MIRTIKRFGKKNSSTILMVMGISGGIAAGVSAVYVTPKALKKLEELHNKQEEEGVELTKIQAFWEDTKAVAPIYAGPVIGAGVSIACIVCSHKEANKRTMAYATAYRLSEATFNEYKHKVAETIGEKKEKKIREEIGAERAEKQYEAAINSGSLIENSGDGSTLFMDSLTGRLFYSDISAIQKAECTINKRLITEMHLSLNEIYDEWHISHIKAGDDIGVNVDTGFDISYSSCLVGNNQPCVYIDYDYAPVYGYRTY